MIRERLERTDFEAGIVTYNALPPHEATSYTSTSWPFAFGLSFTGHRDAVIESAGLGSDVRSFAPGTVGLNGAAPLTWLRVAERSEGLEVHPTSMTLEQVANETGCNWHDLQGFRQCEPDPIVWGICARLRMHSVGARVSGDLEASALIYELTLHIATRYLHGRTPRGRNGQLDSARLERVCAYLHAHALRTVSLRELSAVAALSPFHLQRAFKRATGLSPAAYAATIRMERARRNLAAGWTRKDTALHCGFRDQAHFRRCYRKAFGRD